MVSPKWGLYANLMAQIISQVSSHFIIHYHRRIVEEAMKENQEIPGIVNTDTALMDNEGNEVEHSSVANDAFTSVAPDLFERFKIQLSSNAFSRPHRGDSDKLVTRRVVSPLLIFLAICCITLFILGCLLPSYSVGAYGIVGILVESGQKFRAAESSYSPFTTIALLFDQAKLSGTAADLVGLGSLSIILLLSVLVVPIAQSLVLLIQWFVPLTHRRRYRLMIALEVLQAWQYAEVYLLAILVGSWQLGPISGTSTLHTS
jgi:Paraquat-inducible protein A